MNKTIIIADDYVFIRELTESYLKKFLSEIYSFEQISSGRGLNERLKNDISNVALVVLDRNMPPRPDGDKIIRKYARIVPMIFHYDPSHVGTVPGERALREGAKAYFLKPSYEQVAQKAREILEST